MQLEIPETAYVTIVIGRAVPAIGAGAPPTVLDAAPGERSPPRSGRPLLKGCLAVLLLAASFAAGDFVANRPGAAPALAVTDPPPAALPPGASVGEHGSPAAAEVPVPDALRRQLRQPPAVVPPPGQAAEPASPGATLPERNPFGLEN
jgi:hypothetical protein